MLVTVVDRHRGHRPVLGLLDMAFDAVDGQPVRVETVFWHVRQAVEATWSFLIAYLGVVSLVPACAASRA